MGLLMLALTLELRTQSLPRLRVTGMTTTGLYIYGRPQLSDSPTLGSTLTEGRPGLKVSPAITVTVRDETSSNAPVPNVPVTFKVANTTPQGGLLSYPKFLHSGTMKKLVLTTRSSKIHPLPRVYYMYEQMAVVRL